MSGTDDLKVRLRTSTYDWVDARDGLEAADIIARLESERDSLNAKIDAAPHAQDCQEWWTAGPCTCWKASTGDDALRHVKAQAFDEGVDASEAAYGDDRPTIANPYRIEAGE